MFKPSGLKTASCIVVLSPGIVVAIMEGTVLVLSGILVVEVVLGAEVVVRKSNDPILFLVDGGLAVDETMLLLLVVGSM